MSEKLQFQVDIKLKSSAFKRTSNFLLAFASGQEVGQEARMLSSGVQQKFLFSFSELPLLLATSRARINNR